jgi:hypothetical protein
MKDAKATVKDLLRQQRYSEILERLGEKRRTVRILRSILYEPESLLKWRAVSMFGWLARERPGLIASEVERLIWSLNDEAGSIGRGAAETLGEIAWNNARLVREGGAIVIHYIEDPETCRPPNRNPEILAGVLWAIGRIGNRQPEQVKDVLPTVWTFCEDPDSNVRGHAVWALGQVDMTGSEGVLRKLTHDRGTARVYDKEEIRACTVGELAAEALGKLKTKQTGHPT